MTDNTELARFKLALAQVYGFRSLKDSRFQNITREVSKDGVRYRAEVDADAEHNDLGWSLGKQMLEAGYALIGVHPPTDVSPSFDYTYLDLTTAQDTEDIWNDLRTLEETVAHEEEHEFVNLSDRHISPELQDSERPIDRIAALTADGTLTQENARNLHDWLASNNKQVRTIGLNQLQNLEEGGGSGHINIPHWYEDRLNQNTKNTPPNTNP